MRDFFASRLDEALDFTARRLREIQERHGKDAVAVYGRASLTTESPVSLLKFARVGLCTVTIAYKRPVVHVSAWHGVTSRRSCPTRVQFRGATSPGAGASSGAGST